MLEDSTKIIRESNLGASSTNIINCLWTMMIDYVMDVIDSVMAETIASVECYGCDGIFKRRNEKDKRLDIKAD